MVNVVYDLVDEDKILYHHGSPNHGPYDVMQLGPGEHSIWHRGERALIVRDGNEVQLVGWEIEGAFMRGRDIMRGRDLGGGQSINGLDSLLVRPMGIPDDLREKICKEIKGVTSVRLMVPVE